LMTVEAVAEAVGLSANTVRFHLDRLLREGLVTRQPARPDGPGRPHLVYRAVAAGAVDGDGAYRLLAELLAEGLVRSGDARAALEAGRCWADRFVEAHDPSIGGNVGAEEDVAAVARVVELLTDGGFAPELLADERTIALRSCPFMGLASKRADDGGRARPAETGARRVRPVPAQPARTAYRTPPRLTRTLPAVPAASPTGDDLHIRDRRHLHRGRPWAPAHSAGRWVKLGLATLGFALNFWAWALLSPLGPRLKDSLHLSFEGSIHSEYQDNLFMLSLSRGGPTLWISAQDAATIGVKDNEWVEAVNRNGVLVARAIVTHRLPEGMVFVYHAQERVVNVPIAKASGKRGEIHNSLTRILVKPTHLIGGYAQLSFAQQR